MKTKSTPTQTKSGDYLYQGLMNGLSPMGKKFAEEQVKKFEALGATVPIGIIRRVALTK